MSRTRWVIAGLALTLAGCLGSQTQTTLDEIEGSVSGQPWVEGFVEYTGPEARWAGPPTFVLHVIAQETGAAKISVVPPLFNTVSVKGRRPASSGMSGDQARAVLAQLAQALQATDPGFRGCLSPVRVRLVRADGIVLQKQGCRGRSGWNQIASQSVNALITASVGGD